MGSSINLRFERFFNDIFHKVRHGHGFGLGLGLGNILVLGRGRLGIHYGIDRMPVRRRGSPLSAPESRYLHGNILGRITAPDSRDSLGSVA